MFHALKKNKMSAVKADILCFRIPDEHQIEFDDC